MCDLPAYTAIEKQIAIAMGFGDCFTFHIYMHDGGAGGVGGGPFGKAGAVGVTGLYEVGEIALHHRGDFEIVDGPVVYLIGGKITHCIFDLGGMRGGGAGTGFLEIITIYGFAAAGADLHIGPFPGGEANEAIGGQVGCNELDVVVGSGVVDVENRVCPRTIEFFYSGLIAGDGRLGFVGEDTLVAGFFGVPADEEGDMGLFAGREDGIGTFRKEVAIDVDGETEGVGFFCRFKNLFGRHGAQGREAGCAGGFLEFFAEVFGFVEGDRREGTEEGAAFPYRAGDDVTGKRGRHLRGYGGGAGGLTGDGDLLRIAAEGPYIFLHPFQCGGLIEEAIVAGGVMGGFGCEGRVSEETEDPEAIVDGYRDDAFCRRAFAVVTIFGAVAGDVAAAVEINEDGKELFTAGCFGGLPDIKIETVFAGAGGAELHIAEDGKLFGFGSEVAGFAYALPVGRGLGFAPAKITDGWGGKGDAFVRVHAAGFGDAFEDAVLYFYLGGRGGSGLFG